MTENTCWDALYLIFRKTVDVLTLRWHQGHLILKLIPHRSPMAQSFRNLKMLDRM